MTVIKTIFLVLIMQLVGITAHAAADFKPIKSDSRPGDGNDKFNAKKKHGESLKGYFYRVYGDERVRAKDVKFKGPFKLKTVKKFLKKCQENYGYIQEDSTTQTHEEKYKFFYDPNSYFLNKVDYGKIFHVTLRTRVSCIVYNRAILAQEWAAVYLDNDRGDDEGLGTYIDYVNCSDDRAYLATGEYSIHYDQNPRCHADVSKKE